MASRECPECGKSVPAVAKYCPRCRADVAAPPAGGSVTAGPTDVDEFVLAVADSVTSRCGATLTLTKVDRSWFYGGSYALIRVRQPNGVARDFQLLQGQGDTMPLFDGRVLDVRLAELRYDPPRPADARAIVLVAARASKVGRVLAYAAAGILGAAIFSFVVFKALGG